MFDEAFVTKKSFFTKGGKERGRDSVERRSEGFVELVVEKNV